MGEPRSTACPRCGHPLHQPGVTLIGISRSSISGMPSLEAPQMLGNGNIAWPAGWTDADRRTWRIMMDEPGAEWPEVHHG